MSEGGRGKNNTNIQLYPGEQEASQVTLTGQTEREREGERKNANDTCKSE